MSLSGALARSGRRALPIAVLGVFAGSALAAYAVHGTARDRAHTARFVLSASPAAQAIPAGSTASFQLAIDRRGFRGAVDISVLGTPREANPQLSGTGSHKTLNVVTSGRAPLGRYRLRVRARGGAFSTSIQLALTIQQQKPVAIGISGGVSGLAPGIAKPLDLTLRNPSQDVMWVTGLTVNAAAVSAPRSDSSLPCSLADFTMRQYTGRYPLVLPPFTTRTLSSLGVAPDKQPQVVMLNRPMNQDGCQGASVTLSYTGRGTTL